MRIRNVIFTIIATLILTCTLGFARTTTTDLELVKPIWTEDIDILDDINANSDILEAFANDVLEFDLSPVLRASLDIATFNIEGVDATEFGYLDGVSAFGGTLIDDADAEAARTTLSAVSMALDNIASCAINTSLLLGTSDGGALGSTSYMWSDLFLASGAVINFHVGDITLTHSAEVLTLAGGLLAAEQLTLTKTTIAAGAFTGLTTTVTCGVTHTGNVAGTRSYVTTDDTGDTIANMFGIMSRATVIHDDDYVSGTLTGNLCQIDLGTSIQGNAWGMCIDHLASDARNHAPIAFIRFEDKDPSVAPTLYWFDLGGTANAFPTGDAGDIHYHDTLHIRLNSTDRYIPLSTVEGTYTTTYPIVATDLTVTNDITGSITGNAETVTFADNDATDEANEILFAGNAAESGDCVVEADSDFTYNPSTGTLTTTAITVTGAIATATDISMTGELDMTGANALIDLNPAQTGTACIIDITPTAAIAAASDWDGICIDGDALDPLTGNTTFIHGLHLDFSGVVSADGDDAVVGGAYVLLPTGDTANCYAYTHALNELTVAGMQVGFGSLGGSLELSFTATYRGMWVDWDGITRNANAPVLEGIRVELPADYSNFGTSFGAYFSGGGETVTICDGTYSLNISGNVLLDGTFDMTYSNATAGGDGGFTSHVLQSTTALTGTLRGAYITASNYTETATGTIRGLEVKARTEQPGGSGGDVNVLEGISISADSKAHSVTTMRGIEVMLDGSTGGTVTEGVGIRIANNMQADKITTMTALQIYSDSFPYDYGIDMSQGAGGITTDIKLSGGTTLTSRAMVVPSGGKFNISIGGASGDDFTVDTNKLVVLGDTGYVGIGTATPGFLLDIHGSRLGLKVINNTAVNSANDITFWAQNINSGDHAQTSFYFTNDRGIAGAFASYGGLIYGGSGYTADPIFGFNRNDKMFLVTYGNNNLGMYLGTTVAQPLIFGTNNTEKMRIISSGNIGLHGVTVPTAKLHLPAGTAAASTAPLKFMSGPLLTAEEAGTIEFLTDAWYGTITTGPTRKQFAFTDIVDDTAYGAGWDAVTAIAPSKNAVYDKIEALSSADLSDVASIAMLDETEVVLEAWDFQYDVTIFIEDDDPAVRPTFTFRKARDGDPDYDVHSGDEMGALRYDGRIGPVHYEGANIRAIVDVTPGAGDMPGRLEFLTTPDGAGDPVLRLAIDNAGNIKMGDGAWTNYVNVTNAGAMTAEGTASIEATDLAITNQAEGDILYFDGSNWIRLAKGTAGQVLTMNAGETAPEWQTP